MLFGALAPLIPGYADELGLSKTGAGLLVASFGAGALLGGIPGGLAALRWGPRTAVVAGLVLLAGSSFAFAAAEGPWALGLARFVQGASSTTTWAGALAWLTVATPRERRGELIGIAFGAAVFGAILGPMFGAVADAVGIGASFAVVGAVAVVLAGWAATRPGAAPEQQSPGAVSRAFADRGFIGGLWLNTLPAWLFGTLVVLVPLQLGLYTVTDLFGLGSLGGPATPAVADHLDDLRLSQPMMVSQMADGKRFCGLLRIRPAGKGIADKAGELPAQLSLPPQKTSLKPFASGLLKFLTFDHQPALRHPTVIAFGFGASASTRRACSRVSGTRHSHRSFPREARLCAL